MWAWLDKASRWALAGRSDRHAMSLGTRGERIAARYLRRQGMTIVGRNQRLAGGELDLIAVEGRTVVFVEVKTRRSQQAGHPLEAITMQKQRHLSRAALAYLRRHQLLEHAARFDVIAVIWPESPAGGAGTRPQIRHVRNAFELSVGAQMFV